MNTLFDRKFLAALIALFCFVNDASALDVEIQMNPDPVKPGELLRAEITVSNNSTVAVSNVSVEATVPGQINQFRPAFVTSGGATCVGGACDAGEAIVWSLGALGPGQGTTVSVLMPVSSSAVDGTLITMPVRTLINGIEDSIDSKSVTVDVDAILRLNLDLSTSTATIGEDVVLTISYGNRDVNATIGTNLSLPLPLGLSFVSATGGGSFNTATRRVEWGLGTFAGRSNDRQQVVVRPANVSPGQLLTIENAEITGTSIVTGSAEAAISSRVIRVAASTPLQVVIEMAPNPLVVPLVQGEIVQDLMRVEFTVVNTGATTQDDVTLVSWMPLGIDDAFTPNSPANSTNGDSVCTAGICFTGTTINWNLGSLAPGEGVTVAYAAWSSPLILVAGDLVGVDVTATSSSGEQVGAAYTIPVETVPGLRLQIDESDHVAQPGDELEYTVFYGNAGDNLLTDTRIRLPLPAGTSFESASDNAELVDNVIEWLLGDLSSGASGFVTARLAVNPGVIDGQLLIMDAGEITGTNVVTSAELKARAMAVSRVAEPSPLEIFVEMNPGPIRPEQLLLAEVTVSNSGNFVLTNVEAVVWHPDGTGGNPSTNGGGILRGNNIFGLAQTECVTVSGGPSVDCEPGRVIRMNFGDLAPGTTNTVTFGVFTAGTEAGSVPPPIRDGEIIHLDAIVSADGGLQAKAAQSTLVDSEESLQLRVDESPDPEVIGGEIKYTLNYGNSGTVAVTDASMRLPVPDGLTFVSASGGGELVNGAVLWDLTAVAAGGGGARQATFSTAVNLPSGALLPVNAATIEGLTAVGQERRSARATAVSSIGTSKPALLDVRVVGPALQGGPMTVEYTITNNSVFILANVIVISRVIEEITDAFGTSFPASALNDGAICSSSFSCFENTGVGWPVAELLNPGQTVTVSMTPPVNPDLPDGRVFTIDAYLFTTTVPVEPKAAYSVLLGPDRDGDFDGVPDVDDNCQFDANPLQEDNEQDGIGDVCDNDDDNDGKLDLIDPYPFGFADVAIGSFAFDYIEAIAIDGITAGCGKANYCPNDSVTRAQMAVFLLRGKFGSAFVPPPAIGIFDDVPPNSFAAAWIEALAAEGITVGCGNGNYCPNNPVTRAQMAVFLLRAKYGTEYSPPPAVGVFSDVSPGSFAAAWIESLAAEGITAGCGNGNYCPNNAVTRAQMAVFLSRTFGLLL